MPASARSQARQVGAGRRGVTLGVDGGGGGEPDSRVPIQPALAQRLTTAQSPPGDRGVRWCGYAPLQLHTQGNGGPGFGRGPSLYPRGATACTDPSCGSPCIGVDCSGPCCWSLPSGTLVAWNWTTSAASRESSAHDDDPGDPQVRTRHHPPGWLPVRSSPVWHR